VGGPPEAFQDLDRGGFAGAVGSQEGEDLAVPDLQVDAAHGLGLTVVLGEAVDADHRLGGPRGRRRVADGGTPQAHLSSFGSAGLSCPHARRWPRSGRQPEVPFGVNFRAPLGAAR
jgi:hypothetical protein